MTIGIDNGERKEKQGHVPMGNDGGQATATPGDRSTRRGLGMSEGRMEKSQKSRCQLFDDWVRGKRGGAIFYVKHLFPWNIDRNMKIWVTLRSTKTIHFLEMMNYTGVWNEL